MKDWLLSHLKSENRVKCDGERSYGDLIAQASPFKYQTEETCLRLYKSISGALQGGLL